MNNNLIKKLSEKASHQSPDGYPVTIPYNDAFVKKFTELIILEIIREIEPDEEWRRDASWGYIGGEEGVELLDGAINTIKGHFGVKS